VNGGEVSDEGEESLEDLEVYVYMQSFIVWMVARIAERETACKVMRHWREPRAMVIN
jgi:hypothetical protein